MLRVERCGKFVREKKLHGGFWALALNTAAQMTSRTLLVQSDLAPFWMWFPRTGRRGSITKILKNNLWTQRSDRIKGGYSFILSFPLSVFESTWRRLKIIFSLPQGFIVMR